MSETKFKLNDGREITVQYTQNNGTSRYSVLIDGKIQERDIYCGIGWNTSSIEEVVRDRYETQEAPVLEDNTKIIMDPSTTKPKKYDIKKRSTREIRSIDFKLEGLLTRADLKLIRKPSTELETFFSAAKELQTIIQEIRTLAIQTNDPELKEKADAIKQRYVQSGYCNY
jgi:hypothetical protein